MNTTHNLSATSLDLQVAFNEPHARAIRVWHWTFFIVMTAQHLGGVIIADLGKYQGIVSGMIHWKKRSL
jgi:hypothetical protein